MLSDKKDFVLHIRLTRAFSKELFEYCKKFEENVSTFCREAIITKLEKEKELLNINGSNEN